MPTLPKSLAMGRITEALNTIFTVSTGINISTSLISFTNTHSSSVVLNCYKRSGSVTTLISPKDFIFDSNNMAQEVSPITLIPGDKILASCSVGDVVDFSINGFIYTL